MDPVNTQLPNVPTEKKRFPRIKLSKKLVIILCAIFVVVVGAVLWYFFKATKGDKDTVIASVNQQPVYKGFLDKEIELYPKTPTKDEEKMLEQKVIDDQVTLEGAKKEGLIKEYDNDASMDTPAYLARTKQVQDIKKKINESANSISGKIVGIWMFNNEYVGKMGHAKAKEIAYNKIKPLYDQVKSGKITITEAGQLIATDTTLKEIDPVWEVNALQPFEYYKGKPATFWPEFNKILWETPEGEVTPLYLGKGTENKTGTVRDELYMFAQVEKRITDKPYSHYDEWLEQQKKSMSVRIMSLLPEINYSSLRISKVFADDNPCNDCRDTHGETAWTVTVYTQTGAVFGGAETHYQNRRSSEVFRGGQFSFGPSYAYGCDNNEHVFKMYSNTSNGRNNDGSIIPKAYAMQQCGESRRTIGNFDSWVNHGVTCVPPPPSPSPTPVRVCGNTCSTAADCAKGTDGCTDCIADASGNKTCQRPPTPTPTPIACGSPCTTPANCQGAINGCTYCLPNAAGARVCSPARACNQPCDTPTDCQSAEGCGSCLADGTGKKTCQAPPACGTKCSDDSKCVGAPNGCTSCVPNDAGEKVCAPAPACGNECVRDDQCAGARDGCNVCMPNGKGKKVCTKPACGVACERDDQCAGAKDGCTTCGESDTGSGKVCRPQAACGVACTKDSQCAGARDGCTFCTAGKCSAFNPDMCSCDGIDFVAKSPGATFLPGDNVTFVAFGKVPGKDWKGSAAAALSAAQVSSIQLSLYQSKASDPNSATRIAQSAAITPVVVENTASKVRYKVTWDQKIPSSPPPGTIYRVQAVVKCSPKSGVLGATTAREWNYFTQLYDSVSSMFAQGSVLAVTTAPVQRQEQQLETFNPQARILEKTCTLMRFTFD